MAIEKRVINNKYTEIYVGGGNFITQSAPTNFHQFYKQKILTAHENIEDFKEVTAAEKAKLEEADAKWVRPEQALIDRWNTLCEIATYNYLTPTGSISRKSVGQYNESTGYFEAYDHFFDIDAQEAMNIIEFSNSWLGEQDNANNPFGGNYFHCSPQRGNARMQFPMPVSLNISLRVVIPRPLRCAITTITAPCLSATSDNIMLNGAQRQWMSAALIGLRIISRAFMISGTLAGLNTYYCTTSNVTCRSSTARTLKWSALSMLWPMQQTRNRLPLPCTRMSTPASPTSLLYRPQRNR